MGVTSDLSEFGLRELQEAQALLHAMDTQPLPGDMRHQDEVSLCLNRRSGMVFLSDSYHSVCVLRRGRLEQWHSCPYCGHEGVREDMDHTAVDPVCVDYMIQIGLVIDGMGARYRWRDEQ